jgi:hypothetical protein
VNFYKFYKLQANHKRKERIFLHKDPWKLLGFRKLSSLLTNRPLHQQNLAQVPSGSGGELAAGEVGPELANK